MTDLPVSRRRFLATAAVTAGSVALPSPTGRRAAAVPRQVTLPDRGIYDTSPATAWTDGFLTGNGEYGAVLYGTPALEKVIQLERRQRHVDATRVRLPGRQDRCA